MKDLVSFSFNVPSKCHLIFFISPESSLLLLDCIIANRLDLPFLPPISFSAALLLLTLENWARTAACCNEFNESIELTYA